MNAFPNHIAFIMDGNRRWARKNKMTLAHAYCVGGDALCLVIDYFILSKRTITLSFFAFSKENWSRPQVEIDTLFSSVEQYCQNIIKRYEPGAVFFRFIGDRSLWPSNTRKSLESLERIYSIQSSVSVVIAVNYSGQWDVDQAVTKAIKLNKKDSWNQFMQASEHSSPEILIRTGFQQRISNFYLYYLAYTELFFPKVLWPDFDTKSLNNILDHYKRVERNFGNTVADKMHDLIY